MKHENVVCIVNHRLVTFPFSPVDQEEAEGWMELLSVGYPTIEDWLKQFPLTAWKASNVG